MAAESETTWRDTFITLKEYTRSCEDITLTRQSLSVPEKRRKSFYMLVSKAQKALASHSLGNTISQGKELATHCAQMREKLILQTNLKEFRLASAIENFIEDPEATMAKLAFGIVLDGMQQGLTLEQMEEQSDRQIPPFCRDLFRNAYEAWLYYGVVAALEPKHFYGVYSSDTLEVQAVPTESITVGDQITSPERRIPEAIFVTKDERIFAMKSEVARELDYYGMRITRRRDFSCGGNTIDQIAHRVLLLYRLESLEKIPLLANRDKLYLLPSDLMCEFLLPQEIEQSHLVSLFVDRIKTVRSRHPVQVLTWDEKGTFPVEMSEDITVPSVQRRVIRLDEENLKEIAKLLN